MEILRKCDIMQAQVLYKKSIDVCVAHIETSTGLLGHGVLVSSG